MSSNNPTSHTIQIHLDEKMAEGLRKHLATIPLLPIDSRQVTPEQMAQTFDDLAAAARAVQAAAATHAATVKAYRDKRAQMAPFVKASRTVVIGMFQQSPDTLADFGLRAPRAGHKTTAVKAEAVAKNEATRKARHTMGKRQKEAIKGDVTGVVVTPATPPSPAPAPSGLPPG